MTVTVSGRYPKVHSNGSEALMEAAMCDLTPHQRPSPLPSHRQPSDALILIVDDQATNLKMLRQLLADTPYQLTFASSGQQALERAKASHPDLILLDLLMPDMDGLTVCQQLKREAATAGIPVIFLTASHETEHLLQAFEQGAVDYVTKPFRSEEVLARIRTHLALKQTQRELDGLNRYLDDQVQQRTAALLQSLSFARTAQGITRSLRDTLDEIQIFATVVQALSEALGLQSCQIATYDSDRAVAAIAYACTDGVSSPSEKEYPFTRFQPIYGELHQGRTVQTSLLNAADHGLSGSMLLLACPLQDHQRVIGDIWLYRRSSRPFSAEEVQLVEQIANHSAIAIRQARLFEGSQAQVEELERLNHAKDDFLKTVSHELRTPLTSIKAVADTLQSILQQPNWQTEHQQSIEKVIPLLVGECDREIKLVNTMLEFIYLDVTTVPLSDDIRLDNLVNSITPLYKQRLQVQEQTLTVNLADNLPLLRTDTEILSRILIELLDNACRYTPHEGELELSAACSQDHVDILVSNSGVTLTEKELSRIFDKFYRLPQRDRWQHGGVGLGLALVEKQVHYLGGSIRAVQDRQRFQIWLKLPAPGAASSQQP